MSLSVQFLSLLAMIGTGIVAGAFMDLIGTGIDKSSKRSILRKYSAVIEVIGWVLIGCASFYVLFIVRDGAWRMYDPFAQVSGILLYASIFHRPFRFFGRLINFLIIRPILFVILLVVRIIRVIIRLIVKLLRVISVPFVYLYNKVYSSLFQTTEK
ncbi:spore cortex biosynthesis protein YabQ [Sporosarcina oncorhynchi]